MGPFLAVVVVIVILLWLFMPGMSKNHDSDWWGF